jgi:PAS domain-containing protein
VLTKIAFLHTPDQRLIVLAEILSKQPQTQGTRFALTAFDHENTFLRLAATAGLSIELTTNIITAVLLSVSHPTFPHRWIDLEISEPQISYLGLPSKSAEGTLASAADSYPAESLPSGFAGSAEHFYDFLMQAPTPFTMLTGPEHRFTFINPPYLRLISRTSAEAVLGKPVREVFPELEGRPFFDLLDRVFLTGLPYVGIEALVNLKTDGSGETQERYLDFIYHPIHDVAGEVSGVMVQATDVTERVLAREVTNNRENRIYDQWLELEAIYKTAPVGLIVFSAKDLKVLRVNKMHADFLGASIAELQDKSIRTVETKAPAFKELLEDALKGKQVRNTVIETVEMGPKERRRAWLVNITPLLNESGAIDKLCSISLEMPSASWSETGAYTGDRYQGEPTPSA